MVLRLDPRFPLIWRTPQSLQFGLDRPRVVLQEVSHADEMVIAALVTGVSSSGARMIGRSAGLDDHGFAGLMRALEPALEHAAHQIVPVSVVVTGDGETAHLIRVLLGASGVAILADEPQAHPEIAVLVAHFVIEPEDHGRWLRRDIPHLAVVFGDETVRVGPIIRPGSGPCLYCLERHRTDSDSAWPAMASQLWRRRSGLDSSLMAQEVATTVARLVFTHRMPHRIESPTAIDGAAAIDDAAAVDDAASIVIDAATGERMLREWRSHPECGCGSLTA